MQKDTQFAAIQMVITTETYYLKKHSTKGKDMKGNFGKT